MMKTSLIALVLLLGGMSGGLAQGFSTADSAVTVVTPLSVPAPSSGGSQTASPNDQSSPPILPVYPIPEPGTLALAGLGVSLWVACRRRQAE